jgi:hypothetical protein
MNKLAKRGLYIISSTSCDRQRTLPDVVLAIHRGNIIRHLYDCIEQLYSRRCLPLVFSPFRNTTDTTHCMRSEKETNKIKQNQKSIEAATGDVIWRYYRKGQSACAGCVREKKKRLSRRESCVMLNR